MEFGQISPWESIEPVAQMDNRGGNMLFQTKAATDIPHNENPSKLEHPRQVVVPDVVRYTLVVDVL